MERTPDQSTNWPAGELPTLFIVLLGPAAINIMDTMAKH
jgi:hypothetical protein